MLLKSLKASTCATWKSVEHCRATDSLKQSVLVNITCKMLFPCSRLPTQHTLKPTSRCNFSLMVLKKVKVNYTVIFLEKINHCCSLWAGTVCVSITSQGINCFSAVSRMASACWTKSRSKVISQIAWEQILRLSYSARHWILKWCWRMSGFILGKIESDVETGNQHWVDEWVDNTSVGWCCSNLEGYGDHNDVRYWFVYLNRVYLRWSR